MIFLVVNHSENNELRIMFGKLRSSSRFLIHTPYKSYIKSLKFWWMQVTTYIMNIENYSGDICLRLRVGTVRLLIVDS